MEGFNALDGIFNWVINFSNNLLMPIMIFTIFTGVIFRYLSYWTLKREEWFTKAFSKRAEDYVENHEELRHFRSFFVMTKYLLEKTYYELFIVRSIHSRRSADNIMAMSDRIFLIQQGCARIVKDTERQTKFFRYDIHRPKMIETSKIIFQNNPCFNKIFGVIPITTINDIVAMLPGMVIIMGIFGTFVGIMDALPKVSGMDLADAESSKKVMDAFLFTIAHSMKSSILGIFLSVMMSIVNSLFNPYRVFVGVVEKYENTLDMLWNACNNNSLPKDLPKFNEHRDPIEALQSEAIANELKNLPEYNQELKIPPVQGIKAS